MSRECMEYSHVRRRRHRQQLRRVRGCVLAAALMAALAAYAGTGMARPAEAPPPAREPVSTIRGPVFTGPEEDALMDGELEELVSGVLAEIVTEGMSPLEQARAVFDFVHDSIRYTGSSEKSDWVQGAYDGLTVREGDCYTFYAVSRAMLTALEIDNLPVEREGGETHHYWNLVNCGNGWYHFDACPRSSRLPAFLDRKSTRLNSSHM